ncbi:amidophosphoribosyltransferase [candidate division KSB1 bacterium]|nr:MAG: amidophosphoribosyltransferase [candidate division KSB1 bacterium]
MKRIKEYCGIIGIAGHPQAAEMAYLGLYALQHRGQEGAGIVSCENGRVYRHVGRGLVNDVFASPGTLKSLKGSMAIGHNRYSTTGTDKKENVQPLLVNTKSGFVGLGHNGNLVNSKKLRYKLQQNGAIFQTTTDSELILHLIAISQKHDIVDQIKDALTKISGAFSLVIQIEGRIIAARDPNGFRPLALGKLDQGYVVASETCAMDLIGAEYMRDVHPGELVIIDKNGFKSQYFTNAQKSTHCIFEFIYFSRPDSRIFGEYVDKTRRKLGRKLAEEHPADADIVISVPDSSNTAALGYANASGIPFEIGLIRNHYIGRTFIQPQQSIRNFNVKVKFNTVGGVLKNKRVVIVEDSIVRGTTLKMLTQQLRNAGAKEVHIRVSSPPIKFPCYYGMDFPTMEELIATGKSVKEIEKFLGVDSLGYLSIEGLVSSVPSEGRGYCTACFDGKYPVEVEKDFEKEQYE